MYFCIKYKNWQAEFIQQEANRAIFFPFLLQSAQCILSEPLGFLLEKKRLIHITFNRNLCTRLDINNWSDLTGFFFFYIKFEIGCTYFVQILTIFNLNSPANDTYIELLIVRLKLSRLSSKCDWQRCNAPEKWQTFWWGSMFLEFLKCMSFSLDQLVTKNQILNSSVY